MAPRFFSKEWLDEVVKKVNSDEAYLRKSEKFNAKMIIIVTDCPDGKDVRINYTYEKGKVAKAEYEAKTSPADFRVENSKWDDSQGLCRTQASYETWGKLQRKELNVMTAMNAKLYITEGDMTKVLPLVGYVNSFADAQTTVPCEY